MTICDWLKYLVSKSEKRKAIEQQAVVRARQMPKQILEAKQATEIKAIKFYSIIETCLPLVLFAVGFCFMLTFSRKVAILFCVVVMLYGLNNAFYLLKHQTLKQIYEQALRENCYQNVDYFI